MADNTLYGSEVAGAPSGHRLQQRLQWLELPADPTLVPYETLSMLLA